MKIDREKINLMVTDLIEQRTPNKKPYVLYFETKEPKTISIDLSKIPENGHYLVWEALEAFTRMTGLKFTETPNASNTTMRFTNIFENGNRAIIVHNSDTGKINHSKVNFQANFSHEISEEGENRVRNTLLHEIGHALGLNHPFEYFETTFKAFSDISSSQVTVMTYNYTYGTPLTPQIADIIAIQQLYGKTPQNTGDTIYGISTNLTGYLKKAFDIFMSPDPERTDVQEAEYTMTIIDNGGNDTIDFSNDVFDQNIILLPFHASIAYEKFQKDLTS